MDEQHEVDVQELSDEELIAVSGGIGPKYCPMGTFKMCETKDGVKHCWCEPIPGYKNPLHS